MSVKISALPAATALTGTEVFPVVQGGTTKKSTITQVLDAVDTNISNMFGEGFHEPSVFTNSFAQGVTVPGKIWQTGYNGRAIYFRGTIDCSLVTFTPGSYIQAFRLPNAYRPMVTLNFPVFSPNDAVGVCQIQNDGYVYFKNVTGDMAISGIIDMASISYYVDPF